jgi:phosphate:Na+ symporter
MNIKDMIFGTAGGLGLFLFGMVLMSDGLKQAAGRKLKDILQSMTKRPIVAFLVGAGVTALVQASGATTVMVVGFVNAGLLTLKQAICVIIGANVGTTATAWLVSASGLKSLDITSYALPMVALGFLLKIGGRTRGTKSLGEVMLGLGLLFVGIDFMKNAFAPLAQSPRVHELFVSLVHKPMVAIIVATVFTILLQSSSAMIAIVQILAMQGAFGQQWDTVLAVAIPFVLGGNIGTTITAQLAALQANRNARRAAWAHTLFNVLGCVIAYPFVHYGLYGPFVKWISPWEIGPGTIASSIAVAHTLFNVVNSFIFLALVNVLVRIVKMLVPLRPSEAQMAPIVLEKHLLDTPEIALEQAKREINHMAKTAREALQCAIDGIMQDDRKKLSRVGSLEDFIDTFQLEITSYLTELSSRHLSEEVSIELPVLLHCVNDLERIGDHAINIEEIADRKIEHKLSFSDFATEEAERLRSEIDQMFSKVIAAQEKNDVDTAKSALGHEANLNKMQVDFRRSHVERMSGGTCSAQAGLIFIDLVDNVEKIGDHLTNISQAIIGGLRWEGIKPKIWPGY